MQLGQRFRGGFTEVRMLTKQANRAPAKQLLPILIMLGFFGVFKLARDRTVGRPAMSSTQLRMLWFEVFRQGGVFNVGAAP